MRCHGLTKKGNPCKNKAGDNGYCHVHPPPFTVEYLDSGDHLLADPESKSAEQRLRYYSSSTAPGEVTEDEKAEAANKLAVARARLRDSYSAPHESESASRIAQQLALYYFARDEARYKGVDLSSESSIGELKDSSNSIECIEDNSMGKDQDVIQKEGPSGVALQQRVAYNPNRSGLTAQDQAQSDETTQAVLWCIALVCILGALLYGCSTGDTEGVLNWLSG